MHTPGTPLVNEFQRAITILQIRKKAKINQKCIYSVHCTYTPNRYTDSALLIASLQVQSRLSDSIFEYSYIVVFPVYTASTLPIATL